MSSEDILIRAVREVAMITYHGGATPEQTQRSYSDVIKKYPSERLDLVRAYLTALDPQEFTMVCWGDFVGEGEERYYVSDDHPNRRVRFDELVHEVLEYAYDH